MNRCPITLIALLANASCALNLPPVLNSERIKNRFGSYGIEVLRHDDAVRLSSLYSGGRSHNTTRTIALVEFNPSRPVQIAGEHQRILDGASIGATFREHGWAVSKHQSRVGTLQTTRCHAEITDRMKLSAAVALAVHRYDFEVARAGERIRYATITEIHHPDYLRISELSRIFAPVDQGGSEFGDKVGSRLALALDTCQPSGATRSAREPSAITSSNSSPSRRLSETT